MVRDLPSQVLAAVCSRSPLSFEKGHFFFLLARLTGPIYTILLRRLPLYSIQRLILHFHSTILMARFFRRLDAEDPSDFARTACLIYLYGQIHLGEEACSCCQSQTIARLSPSGQAVCNTAPIPFCVHRWSLLAWYLRWVFCAGWDID